MSAPGTNKVDFHVTDNVAVVTLDHFPVNTLTNAVQLGIEDAAAKIAETPTIQAVIVRGAGTRAFCAGADIQDLNRPHDRYPSKPFMEHFESLNVPVVALLQGFTLGGGLELSLGCHYRVATPATFVGLPEVNIGLLPGGQGTQRLPRLVGVEASLKIMLTGQHVPAKQALGMKLIDSILSPASIKSADVQLSEAIAFAKSKASDNLALRRNSQLAPPAYDDATKETLAKFSASMKSRRRNEKAPQAIIGCVAAACESKTFQEGVDKEQELFFEVLTSKEAKALQYIFFGERAAAKVPGLKAKPAKVSKVAVIGAGTMGGGITMCFANIGIQVVMVDTDTKFTERGLKVIQNNYKRSVDRKSMSQKNMDKALSLISTTTDYKDLADVDLVIEAVFEDLQLKKEIFKKLEQATKPECILASNTSFLDIDAMASATNRPSKVVGMHFFSPANVMKLLENIRGRNTDETTIATVMALGAKINKWPVLVNNKFGFVGNRMIRFYGVEAQRMVLQGAEFTEVDQVAFNFGMPMGPFRMQDLVGLDIGYQARKKAGILDEKKNFSDAMVGKGRLGMKNGKGWFDYNGRKQSMSAETTELINNLRKNHNLPQRSFSKEEIIERLFYPIVNEGFKVLQEKVTERPEDIDAVYVHGYNFPRVTGGPMFWADNWVGLDKVLAGLEKAYAETKGEAFKPAPLLRDCVKSGDGLKKFWKENQAKYKFDANNANL